MILVFTSTKGGVGKTDLSFNVATALLSNFRLIEIDDNNNTSSVLNQSTTLQDKTVSVKTVNGDSAFADALFDGINTNCDIIIDAGGGNDSKAVIQMIINQTDKDETIFVIPLMAGRKHVQNAVDTYNLVKDRKVIFALNGAKEKSDFVFWHGSEEEDIPSVDAKLLKLPSVFVPWTQLFDKAAMTNEVIADLYMFCENFANKTEARAVIGQKSNGDRAEFKRMLARYNLSAQVNNFY